VEIEVEVEKPVEIEVEVEKPVEIEVEVEKPVEIEVKVEEKDVEFIKVVEGTIEVKVKNEPGLEVEFLKVTEGTNEVFVKNEFSSDISGGLIFDADIEQDSPESDLDQFTAKELTEELKNVEVFESIIVEPKKKRGRPRKVKI